MSARPTLEEARARLRELGYLDGRVERLLFRPVFEGRGGAFLPAILIGAAAASLAALAAVAAAERGPGAAPGALAALFLHVFLADLLPAALPALALTALADRVRAPGVTATVSGLVCALAIFTLWIGGTYSLSRGLSVRSLLWGIPVALAALLLAAAVRLAFLARAFARRGTLPRRTMRRVFAGAAALGFLVAILLFSSHESPAAALPPQPSPRKSPTVVVAVDGLDLDGAGKDSAAAAVLAGGAAGWWPAERGSAPEIWTTIATGVSPARHGVRALARVRPRGSSVPLRPPFGTAWYLRRVGPALGLVVNAPVSSSDRRSEAFWEVAASAGIPSLSVGWWASGPWPGTSVVENRAVFARAADGPGADRVAIALFEPEARKGFGVATVYLPGCDIARGDPALRATAMGRIADFLPLYRDAAARGEIALVVITADSHPTGRAPLGRMFVFDGAPRPQMVRMRPEDAAPSILARSGIPPARDLDGGPVAALFAPGTMETGTVASYGPRTAPEASAAPASDKEYLEKLRSLGYLQ